MKYLGDDQIEDEDPDTEEAIRYLQSAEAENAMEITLAVFQPLPLPRPEDN